MKLVDLIEKLQNFPPDVEVEMQLESYVSVGPAANYISRMEDDRWETKRGDVVEIVYDGKTGRLVIHGQ